jgi:hypothetical protein
MAFSSLHPKGKGALMSEHHDWDKILEWEQRLGQGEAVDLSPDRAGLLQRVARELAIPEEDSQL